MQRLHDILARIHSSMSRSARWVLIAALISGSAGLARAQDPVIPRVMVRPQVLSVARPTFQAPFAVAARDRDVFTLTLDAAGALQARATWSGDERLALILNGPGQTGYYAREDGGSPLSLSFSVTEDLLEAGSQWRLSVVQFGSGRPTEGTLAVTLPRPTAPATPPVVDRSPVADYTTDRANWREVIESNRLSPLRPVSPDAVLIDRPELLRDGSMRFRLPNGLVGQLSPTDTLTLVNPDVPDSTETIALRSTNVQNIDPPDPPDELLSATGNLNAWWGLMQMWMEGMNERMRLSLAQAFPPPSMVQFESIEADANLDSPFERADYRLRYLENVLLTLLAQTAEEPDSAPPPNND